MNHILSLEGDLNSNFDDTVKNINAVYVAGCKAGIDITHKRAPKLVKKPSYTLLAEFDGTVFGMFESTIRIRDYDGDLAVYLGDTDISNEVPWNIMEEMIDENQ